MQGSRLTFDVFWGAQNSGKVKIDLTVGAKIPGAIETFVPQNRILIEGLHSVPYRLHPVANQVADKVCASLAFYNSVGSSRSKDLVDLVILAITQKLKKETLRIAIFDEAMARKISIPAKFVAARGWETTYPELAKKWPVCSDYQTLKSAMELANRFLDLGNQISDSSIWNPEATQWQTL